MARSVSLRLAGPGQRTVTLRLVLEGDFLEVWHGERFLACFEREDVGDWFAAPMESLAVNGVAFVVGPPGVGIYVRELVPFTPLSRDVLTVFREVLLPPVGRPKSA